MTTVCSLRACAPRHNNSDQKTHSVYTCVYLHAIFKLSFRNNQTKIETHKAIQHNTMQDSHFQRKMSCLMKKTYLVGPDKLYKRSLDSVISSLLALMHIRTCIHVLEFTCTCTSVSEVYNVHKHVYLSSRSLQLFSPS